MAEQNRLENLHSLRLANVDAAFATAFGTLVTGTILVGFIRFLGGSDLWIGWLAAIPSMLGILQIPGGTFGRSFSSYKRFVLPGGLAWRLFYVPVVILPFLAIAVGTKLWILAGCISIGAACVLFVTPVYSDWLAEMVPESSRGWFFSRRNALATAVGATAGLIGGLILDGFHKSATGFSLVFGLGLLCAGISLIPYMRMHDLPRLNPVRQSLWEGVKAMRAPFSDKTFNRVLLFLAITVLGQAFPGNLFGAFALESLKMPFSVIQLCGVLHATGNLLTARFWGFLADKYGNKPLLILVGVGVALTPTMWLFCQPGAPLQNAIILLSGHVIVGSVWAGLSLCQFNILLATAKPEDRSSYLGAALATQAIVGGIAPLLGATLMSNLRPQMDVALAYKWVFIGSMVLRGLAVLFLIFVHEEGALKVRKTLRDLSKVTAKGFLAMRDLSKSSNEAERAQAIRSVGRQNYALAAEEIIRALHDPSPQVRRQAATALAKLDDPKAGSALTHMLLDHPDLIEEETIEALGMIGSAESVEPLTKFLRSPRPIIRRSAARALARIGDMRAVGPLKDAAQENLDPDLRRAALQALRTLGVRDADEIFAEAIMDPAPSVRIAAAEGVSEFRIEAAIPQLRTSLDRFPDEASSEVAYSLGTVGSDSDVERILAVAQRCVSVITRRRCLLGVARLWGVEREVYRLFQLEGLSRDAALYELLRAAQRDNLDLAAALNLYSQGDELAALRKLGVTILVEDLFIVAACAQSRE